MPWCAMHSSPVPGPYSSVSPGISNRCSAPVASRILRLILWLWRSAPKTNFLRDVLSRIPLSSISSAINRAIEAVEQKTVLCISSSSRQCISALAGPSPERPLPRIARTLAENRPQPSKARIPLLSAPCRNSIAEPSRNILRTWPPSHRYPFEYSIVPSVFRSFRKKRVRERSSRRELPVVERDSRRSGPERS